MLRYFRLHIYKLILSLFIIANNVKLFEFYFKINSIQS